MLSATSIYTILPGSDETDSKPGSSSQSVEQEGASGSKEDIPDKGDSSGRLLGFARHLVTGIMQ